MLVYIIISTLRRLRLEDGKFEAILGYTARQQNKQKKLIYEYGEHGGKVLNGQALCCAHTHR